VFDLFKSIRRKNHEPLIYFVNFNFTNYLVCKDNFLRLNIDETEGEKGKERKGKERKLILKRDLSNKK